MSDCACRYCKTRVEDAATAHAEAFYANLYGSWGAWQASKGVRRWVRTANGWMSRDPVIERQKARMRAAAEQAAA